MTAALATTDANIRRQSTILPIAVFVVTRLVMLALTTVYFDGDCATYYRFGRLWLEGQVPYRDFPVEYPPAAATVFMLLATVGTYARFRLTFIGFSLVLDALCFRMLLRRARAAVAEEAAKGGVAGPTTALSRSSGPRSAALYALVTMPLFPVLYVRFDLMPSTACLPPSSGYQRSQAGHG
jgi:hypothetical protein